MGRASRTRPSKLAAKLFEIRSALGLSQSGMVKHLGMTDELSQEYISGFERGTRVPSLPVVLQYARVVGLPMEVLVDDELDLPAEIPTGSLPRRARQKT
jgi:transcriptional regulator with XRE-family HTH domain